MATKLGYLISLPAPGATDVVSRELTAIVNSGAPVVAMLEAAASRHEVVCDQDDVVNLSLRDQDDASNWSTPSVFQFKATDTVPPPQPGELGILSFREFEAADDVAVPAMVDAPVDEELFVDPPLTPASPDLPVEETDPEILDAMDFEDNEGST